MREAEAPDAGGDESVRVTRSVEVPELGDEEAKAAVLAALTFGERAELRVDVVFVDDPTLREMHERFLDDPSLTDVMAFDYTSSDGEADPQAEVYVSADRARAVGRFGRLFISGSENSVKTAVEAAVAAIEAVDGRAE